MKFPQRILSTSITTALLASVLGSLPVHAEEAATWSFPTSVSVVSDYIFRGQSQSWGKPAVQFSTEADHASGLYAGFSGSSVSKSWLPGATMETDFFGGYRNSIAGTVSYDLGVIYYAYPGGNWKKSAFAGYNDPNSLNTAEAYVSLGYKWFTFKTGRTLTEYFGWSTNNSPAGGGFAGDPAAGVTGSTRGSTFYELNASYEAGDGWNFSAQVGRQTVAHSTGLDVNYYKLGVSKALPAGWSAGLFYSASDEPAAYNHFLSLKSGSSESNVARSTVFASLTKAF